MRRSTRLSGRIARTVGAAGVCLCASSVFAQTPPPPVPRPFPQPGATTTTPTSTTPSSKTPATTGTASAPTASQAAAPSSDVLAGAPVFPGAEYLDSLDAGRGQRFYIYGTNATFADVLAYYKQQMRTSGRELFKTPAVQQFDLGRFQEDTMAYPPSIVIKDYVWNNATGYLHVVGATEKRFATIIQIVPAPAR